MIFTNFAAFSGMGSPDGAPHFILKSPRPEGTRISMTVVPD